MPYLFYLFNFVAFFQPHGDASQMQSHEHFRLEQLQEEFDFTTEEELNANRRFKLLMLRDREIAEFRSVKMVASVEKEIPRDAFVVNFIVKCLLQIVLSPLS